VVAHQFCRIGSYAIVQGTTGLNKDVLPFCLIAGYPARHYRLNTIGLNFYGGSVCCKTFSKGIAVTDL
jgi:UDP-N-acetylglucosamine acyltransferase